MHNTLSPQFNGATNTLLEPALAVLFVAELETRHCNPLIGSTMEDQKTDQATGRVRVTWDVASDIAQSALRQAKHLQAQLLADAR